MTQKFAVPSREFDAFVHDRTITQQAAKSPVPADVFARELWSAAKFDWHRQTGEVKELLDGGGLPRDEADTYARMIKTALNAIAARA